jgi:hypothetical protein
MLGKQVFPALAGKLQWPASRFPDNMAVLHMYGR